MIENIKEICEHLQSNERRVKITALEVLQNYAELPNVSETSVLNTFDECYLYLLKCYADPFESVRDSAVNTVTVFLKLLPPNDFHLCNVLATLAVRMGQVETLEESEEIRLLYITQLHVLVKQYVSTGHVMALQECYADIVRVLAKSIRDSYPSVQRKACACVIALALPADTYYFQPWVEQLAIPLYGMLNHKHSQARIAAVEALSYLSLHICPKEDALNRLIMEVTPLLMDNMPLVRRECGQMGILMLLELKDRYSYFDRIIPLVLCCLKDDTPEVVTHIRPLWEKCGKLYYDENETELSKQDLADIKAENYPVGVKRPSIGCRGMVQRSLRLLKLIVRESSDWKENVRLHSLKLLYQFVLHAEAAMTAKFFEIYPDVSRACRDHEAMVVMEAKKVADLMGRLLFYDDWIEHGLNGLEKNAKEGYLKCFYYMYTSSTGCVITDIMRVGKILTEPEFSQTLRPDFQLYILKTLETLLNKSEQISDIDEKTFDELIANIYVVCVKVMALSISTEESGDCLIEKGVRILNTIVEFQMIGLADLHERYFTLALDYVESLDAALEANSEPILLLHGLISICRFRAPYLKELQAKIKLVWENCEDDAKVKIFSTISIHMLSWSENINVPIEKSTELMQQFMEEIIEPHLEWRAGAAAESMRSMATATLCSISQGATEEAKTVLPTLTQYMTKLLEDQNVSTRHYAVKCIANLGPMKVEDLKPLAFATMQRLNDPSASLRSLAAAAVVKFKPIFEKPPPTTPIEEENDYEREMWNNFMKRALDMLLLHLEGPEPRLGEVIEKSLIQLANNYPNLCDERIQHAITKAHNKDTLTKLLKKLKLNEDELGI